jgi:hypothetical protein
VLYTTGIIPKEILEGLLLLILPSAVHILNENALLFNTSCRPLITEFLLNSEYDVLGQWNQFFFENRLNCCDVMNVDDNYYDNMV